MSNSTLRRSASRFTSSITPRDLFSEGHRRVLRLLAEFLRRLLLAFANFPAVDDEVVLVGVFAKAKGAKTEVSEVHRGLRPVEIKIRRFSSR